MVTAAVVAVVGYGLLCLLMFLLQERLLFFPRANDPYSSARLEAHVTRVSLPGGERVGWVLPAARPGDKPLVFYFGGNAEDAAVAALELRQRLDANLVVFNYAGYGASAGAPAESTLIADALAVHDALVASVVHNGTVLAIGRSLGSGVAVQLAARRPLDALALITPYDSIRAVAAGHYPWLPVGALLRHDFDSVAVAGELELPALTLIAERDRVIPPRHAHALAAAYGGAVDVHVLPGTDHNDIGLDPAYWVLLDDFVTTFPTVDGEHGRDLDR